MENNVFATLSSINVNGLTEKKATGGTTLTYLSWASAWKVAKEHFPDLEYEIERNPQTNLPYWYDPQTGYMVFTKVTISGQTHEMWLPVMDGTNRAMKAEPYEVQTKYKKFTVQAATMTDINRTIMRCLTKNIAMFGLGISIYSNGEDLPDQATTNTTVVKAAAPAAPQQPVRDNNKINGGLLRTVFSTIGNAKIDEAFIAKAYNVNDLSELKVYQAQHLIDNIDKLKKLYEDQLPKQEAAIPEQTAMQPQQPEQTNDFNLESLGISENELATIGNIFG